MSGLGAMLSLALRWLLGIFTRLFMVIVNNFAATKIILGTLFIVILPIVINNLLYDLLAGIFATIHTYASANAPTISTAFQWTGLLGYFLTATGVIQALTIIMSAMVCRFALSWIPFVGPK